MAGCLPRLHSYASMSPGASRVSLHTCDMYMLPLADHTLMLLMGGADASLCPTVHGMDRRRQASRRPMRMRPCSLRPLLTALRRLDPQRWGHCAASHAPLVTFFHSAMYCASSLALPTLPPILLTPLELLLRPLIPAFLLLNYIFVHACPRRREVLPTRPDWWKKPVQQRQRQRRLPWQQRRLWSHRWE